MSNYFQTLKRLEQEQAERRATPQQPTMSIEPVPTNPVAEIAQEAAVEPAVARIARVRGPRRRPIRSKATDVDERTVGSFSSLFDNLRALGNGAPVGSIVMSGVSSAESVERVSGGLANEVCRHSLRVVVAELYRSVSQPVLRLRIASSDDQPDPDADREKVLADLAANDLQLDLRGGPVPAELTTWLDRARSAHDIVIIEAPPLAISVDAAIIARACDGLILVVEPRATARDALSAAIERAETVGCNVLGVVMQGRPEWMPRWLRRLTAMRNLF